MAGPLAGLVVTELAGLGPAPFCGMVLADLGAEVIRIDRIGGQSMPIGATDKDVLNRGKLSISINLKDEAGIEVALRTVARSDALIEGFRPGVAERLGVGPGECLARNPTLVYGRMTGWGQTGPLSQTAGHDIGYIALSGALHSIGPSSQPFPPLNLVGDFGGGGMLLALGVLAAIIHARESGEGQVVDAAMVDGSALLMASHHGYLADGWWRDARDANLLDGAAPFYSTYRTADGGHVAIGALEPQFFAELLSGLGLNPDDLGAQNDRDGWPKMRRTFAEQFEKRTRDQWAAHFDGTDACVVPVLSMTEAPEHDHNQERGTFVEIDGVVQPAPAPRFSATPSEVNRPPAAPGSNTREVAAAAGFSKSQIVKLRKSGAIA
jgi:alpha-methylacyl-CoA racemase